MKKRKNKNTTAGSKATCTPINCNQVSTLNTLRKTVAVTGVFVGIITVLLVGIMIVSLDESSQYADLSDCTTVDDYQEHVKKLGATDMFTEMVEGGYVAHATWNSGTYGIDVRSMSDSPESAWESLYRKAVFHRLTYCVAN